MSKSKLMHKLKTLTLMTGGGTLFFSGACIYKENEKFYNKILMPLVHYLPPETSHQLAIFACKFGLFPKSHYTDTETLRMNILGLNFANIIGIAAGFDKQGEAVDCLHNIGFAFVEIGSVTVQPQPGNDKPRVFRLPEDKAIINRYGFNSDGHDKVFERLSKLKSNPEFKGILGINLGKNKTSESSIDDYSKGILKFGLIADYLVINISSPNTPGLRNIQSKNELQSLLSNIIPIRNSLSQKPPILLKLAPDLSTQERKEIAEVLVRKDCQIDGLIISNTTTDRTNLKNQEYNKEIGGLSGAPITNKSTQMIAEMYKLTKGKIPIIGVGGIFNGNDAYEKILAGASLVQIYTSFIYHGPPVITKIKKELDIILKEKGITNISEIVGKENGKFL